MTVYVDRPRMLLIAPQHERAMISQAATGHKVDVMDVDYDEATERLEALVRLDLVWLVLGGDNDAVQDRLLDRVVASCGRYEVVISAPRSGIDHLAEVMMSEAELLVEPSPELIAATLGQALVAPESRLHDRARTGSVPRLQQLSEEVQRIAGLLAEMSERERLSETPDDGDQPPIDAAAIRAMIRRRRLRDQYFPEGLFADPAWDMILDLMAARKEHQRVAVSSLCIAAAVPPTTALRWIKALTEQGMFIRKADPRDGRRVYIELSDDAATRCEAYLRAMQRIGGPII